MKQNEFNKVMIGKFYLSDIIDKKLVKELKESRGEQNGSKKEVQNRIQLDK